MKPAKLYELMRRLIDQTERESLGWESQGATTFSTSFPKYTVEISDASYGGDPEYVLKLYDKEGTLIEKAEPGDIPAPEGSLIELSGEDISAPSSSRMMHRLFAAARRRALGVDRAVDDILSSLE